MGRADETVHSKCRPRSQGTLFPEHLEDYVAEDNPVRVIEVFVEQLDLNQLGFKGIKPLATGRPAYHPSVLLKLYIYGYLTVFNPVVAWNGNLNGI
jgi:transposase